MVAFNTQVPLAQLGYTVPNVGGITTALNNIGTGGQVIGPDQARKSITFINPNVVTNTNLLVYQTTDASGNALAPTFASPGGGIPVLPGALITITGDCQGAWGAVAQSGTTRSLTILSSRE